MPTTQLNKKEVQKLLGRHLSDNELKDRTSYLGLEVVSIKGNNLTLEINPDRPDLLSEQGFSRALSSFLGIKTGLRKYEVKDSGCHLIADNTLKDIRPYTVCAIVKDIKLDSNKIKEIINIQEKLHSNFCRNRKKAAIGIYPLDKVKMPILFTAMPVRKIRFRPLGMKHEMHAKDILAKHPAGKEYGHLLAGLKSYPVFIDAADNILSMPPIINSEIAGKVTKRSKNLFIECSGNDINILHKCLNIIVTALADMSASIYSIRITYPNKTIVTPDLKPRKMSLNRDYVNKVLGLNLDNKQIKHMLNKMGLDYQNSKALIPAYRTDIIHQIDLVEDIAIAYGYNNIKPELPKVATIAEENQIEVLRNKLASILTSLGLLETNTYHLINKEDSKKKTFIKDSLVELESSVSMEYNALRSSLLPSLLKVLNMNKHHVYPQDIFEIAKVFKKQKDDVLENYNLCVALCNRQADFTRIKQILDALSTELGLQLSITDSTHPSFIHGRTAAVKARGKSIGIMGEIHPEVLSNFELEMPVSLFEINIEALLSIIKGL